MQFYTADSTIVVILVVGLLNLIVTGFAFLPATFIFSTSFLSLIYLGWFRKRTFESPSRSLIAYIPGHYLMLLAFTLNSPTRTYIFALWTMLILLTLVYDFTRNAGSKNKASRLTALIEYCIIWGIIIFLFQSLLINNLELKQFASILTRVGLTAAGLIWVGIGSFRINQQFKDGRS